jgi:CubicO group peptidase (beta-lactamase class C family)
MEESFAAGPRQGLSSFLPRLGPEITEGATMAGHSDIRLHRRQLLALIGSVVAAGAGSAFPARAIKATGPKGRGSWIPSQEMLEEIAVAMRIAGVPGLAMAVVEDGRLAWSRTFGVTNRVTRAPVTDSTLFEAASMTKPVFAYLAMRLVDEKLLELDKPLVAYRRPEYLGADPRLDRITVRDVLRHSSGLPNWSDRKLVTIASPGTRYTYSGEAIVWLQLIVEKILGVGLDTFMRARLFDPAGMSSSTFGWDERIAADAVYGHAAPGDEAEKLPAQPTREIGNRLLEVAKKWRRPIASWRYEDSVRAMRESAPNVPASTHDLLLNAAGGLLTTASDYARFMTLMMEGRDRGAWEISDRSRREMLTPQLEVRGREISRGLGWGLERANGHDVFEHSGSNYGIFRTFGMGDAKARRAIVILTNGANGNALAAWIARAATGIDLLKSLL